MLFSLRVGSNISPTFSQRCLWLLLLLLPLSLPAADDAAAAVAENGRPVQALSDATPEWFTIGAQYRFRFENRTGNGFREDASANYGLGRLLLDIDVKPKSWLDFHFQGQDARASGLDNAAPIFRDPFDVRQAWVQLGASEKGWIRARVGRQELKYGGQRLVGPLDWLNTARQFDAVKVNVGKADLNVDFFAASVVVIDTDDFNRRRDGANLHGAYANLNRFAGGGTLEAYALWKTTPVVIGSLGRSGDADLWTTGFRYTRKLGGGFDVETEMAAQNGSFAEDDISAWGAYWVLGYTPAGWKGKPRFSAEYQYGSGDSDPNDSKMGTFDQLYPTGHLYQGTADRIGWRNVSDVRVGVSTQVAPKVSVKFDYFSFWLANRNDNLYGVSGAVAVRTPAGGAQSSHVGQELDAILTWTPVSHATLGGGFGYFFTGKFLQETSPGRRHTFGYLFMNYVL